MVEHACYWFESAPKNVINPRAVGLPHKVDVVIIGGGLAGLSVLYHILSSTPLNVVLVDSCDIGYHASGRCNGQNSFIDHFMSAIKHDELYSLYRYACNITENFIERHNIRCSFKKYGGLHVATDASNLKVLQKIHKHFSDENIIWMNAHEVSTLMPKSNFLGGIYCPLEFTISPYAFLIELVRWCDNIGRRVIINAHVDEVTRHSKNFEIKINRRGIFYADHVVYCTGAYAPEYNGVDFDSRHHHVVASDMLSNQNLRSFPDMHVTFNVGKYGLRTHNNHVILSRMARRKKQEVYDGMYDQKIYQDLVRFAYNKLPAARLNMKYVWSYHNKLLPNKLPRVGPLVGLPNEFVSSGFGDYDFSLAFLAGLMIKDYILGIQPVFELFKPTKNLA